MQEKEVQLSIINQQLKALITGERDWLANMSNAAALLFNELDQLNWAGFYLLKEGELVLGPFQGLPACIRIQVGKGVCGSAVKERRTFVVADVHQFPGHIACDEASASEIVIPLVIDDQVIGVLDIDSPIKNRFDEVDRHYLEEFAEILTAGIDYKL